jgi:hypothetical protein
MATPPALACDTHNAQAAAAATPRIVLPIEFRAMPNLLLRVNRPLHREENSRVSPTLSLDRGNATAGSQTGAPGRSSGDNADRDRRNRGDAAKGDNADDQREAGQNASEHDANPPESQARWRHREVNAERSWASPSSRKNGAALSGGGRRPPGA